MNQPNEAAAGLADLPAFRRQLKTFMAEVCGQLFREGIPGVRVQSERVAVPNLMRIMEATLEEANSKGFASMSLRDLAERTGLSMGGLYAYFSGKDDLVALIQAQLRRQTLTALDRALKGVEEPDERLRVALRTHLYVSEVLRSWFFFAYMEARHLSAGLRARAVTMEQDTESLFRAIITDGCESGVFRRVDPLVAAGFVKALLQDWYLKHGKHVRRGLTVDAYAQEVEDLALRYLEPVAGPGWAARPPGDERMETPE